MLPRLGESDLTLVAVEDFISLHDLVLYVLVPAINGGRWTTSTRWWRRPPS